MAQVMSQGPQTAPSPHGVQNSMPPQSPQQVSGLIIVFNYFVLY